MILLSIAIGYTHHLTKRQSDNRQALLSCGLSFLFRYYDIRKASDKVLERQEGEYNMGRTFHFLGLLELAVRYYERCLTLDDQVASLGAAEEREQNFAVSAAFALREIYLQSGQIKAARKISRRWLQL